MVLIRTLNHKMTELLSTVFVYGTLKTGQPNYYLMKDETEGTCTSRGTARTVEKYPLVISSRYNIPYMLYKPGTGHSIEGELYDVDAAQLKRLDVLENHPKLYERLQVPVVTSGGEELMVDAYFLVKYRENLLELPMMDSYKDGINGHYVGPTKRDSSSVPSPLWWYEVHTGYEKTVGII